MTVEEIQQRVKAIEAEKSDPESAHLAEDDLHHTVLETIADGATNPRQLAEEALKTLTISFPRWYA